jgi:hypothetical protein
MTTKEMSRKRRSGKKEMKTITSKCTSHYRKHNMHRKNLVPYLYKLPDSNFCFCTHQQLNFTYGTHTPCNEVARVNYLGG